MAKKSARLRLLERLQTKALQGGGMLPSSVAPRIKVRPSLAGPVNRIGAIRKAEQERKRQQLIADLTGRTGKLAGMLARTKEKLTQSALTGRLSGIFTGLRKAAAFLTGKRTAAHKALGGTAPRPAPVGKTYGGGVSSVKQTPNLRNPMTSVSSSNVAAVGWEGDKANDQLGTLFIMFTNGWFYQYVNSPKWLYEGLLIAGSKGRYVWQYIRRGLFPDGTPYGSAGVEGYERIDQNGSPFGYTGKRKQIAALRGYRRK